MKGLTIQQAAEQTVLIQDACNLSGVVFSFPRIMQSICDEATRIGQGTEWRNTHPIIIAYLDKLCHLAQIQEGMPEVGIRILDAHGACTELAKETV